jgi:tetratricopeptide (TPR) repeat protein
MCRNRITAGDRRSRKRVTAAHRKGWSASGPRLAAGLTIALLLLTAAAACGANPRERIDFWRQNYASLEPGDDPLAARAHDIFDRVLQAAGTRSGVIPRLYILARDPHGSPFAVSIPDGWVILSKGALNLCYREPELGDDRLAFVLAHEIAHQLKDDFWHMKFFTAIDLAGSGEGGDQEVLEEVRRIAEQTEKILAKELQADEHGIVYASMAGYDTNAVVTEDDRVNFFADWVRALDPGRVEGVSPDPTHPTPEQRAETVKARLRQVLENVELFHVGVLFYQAGDYERAAVFFEEFLRFFPGREVYHNLALCHHQLALEQYGEMHEGSDFPLMLSTAIDAETRADDITLRGEDQTPEQLFTHHMEQAVAHYLTAIDLDDSYVLAYNNLGCAYILNQEYYRAIAVLKDAVRLDSEDPAILNNMGVAFYYAENPGKAVEYLEQAGRSDPEYADPVFNLGKVLYETGREEEALRYWSAYLELEPYSSRAQAVRKALGLESDRGTHAADSRELPFENLLGIEVGMWDDEVPADLTVQSKRSCHLGEYPYVITRYEGGVMTVSYDDEILLAAAGDGFEGTAAGGISAGSSAGQLLGSYGSPARRLSGTRGEVWLYSRQGIAFLVIDDRVRSWLLYFGGM